MAWIVSSSFERNRERSDLVKGAGPPPNSPDWRSKSNSTRVASASPIASSVISSPFGPSTRAPPMQASVGKQDVGRDHDVARPDTVGNPIIGRVAPAPHHSELDQVLSRYP
jgi:hypothetical protein